jgi:tRNA(Arg) A34 adenosine deaminase TadA
METDRFLREAIALARASVMDGGGPFGALVVRDGVVVGRGTNRVTEERDPTAHAEILAVRAACAKLGTHVLAGTTVFASCEPCPMCLGALFWARVERLVFACTRDDAAAAGFDDALFHRELATLPSARRLRAEGRLREEGLAAFTYWRARADRVPY